MLGSKSTLAPATVANYSRPLKVWFNWLEEEGHIPATPFTKAVKFTTRKTDKVIKHVSINDLAKLFAYLTEPARLKTYRGCRDMAVITLFLDSGVRLGELVSLRLCDLDMTNMRCVIRGKTGQRYALFSEPASRHGVWAILLTSLVWPSPYSSPLKARSSTEGSRAASSFSVSACSRFSPSTLACNESRQVTI